MENAFNQQSGIKQNTSLNRILSMLAKKKGGGDLRDHRRISLQRNIQPMKSSNSKRCRNINKLKESV